MRERCSICSITGALTAMDEGQGHEVVAYVAAVCFLFTVFWLML